jgi:hypothetical protein
MKSSDVGALTMPYVGSIIALKCTRPNGPKGGELREVILRDVFTVENELHVEEPMAKKKATGKSGKGKGKKATPKGKKDKKGEKPAPTPPAPTPAVLVAPIYFPISMRLGNVFGDYSALEVGIHIPIFGDISNFEKKIDEAMPKIVGKIQRTMNDITVGSGFGPCWAIADAPPQAAPPVPAQVPPPAQGQQGQAPQGAGQPQFGQGQQQQGTAQPGPTGSSVAGFPQSPGQGQQG